VERQAKPDISHQGTKSTKRIEAKIVFYGFKPKTKSFLVIYISKYLRHYQQEVIFMVLKPKMDLSLLGVLGALVAIFRL